MNISSIPDLVKDMMPGTILDFRLPDLSNLNVIDKLQTTLDQIMEPLKAIGEFCSYIIHPTKIFMAFWNWTFNMSFYICLFIALGSTLAYICGYKKYAKAAPLSVVVYVLIQAIGSVFK